MSKHSQTQIGMGYALLAYCTWGVFPVYWKLLKGVPHLEVLVHRILWSALFLVSVLLLKQGRGVFVHLLQVKKSLPVLAVSAALISLNWFTYIYAVNTDHVLEASLGYFMAPLVNILLATLILKERLRLTQKVSVVLALAGVLQLSFHIGRVPYLAILLAVSFGLYGLVRKKVPLDPLSASSVESSLQIVPAFILFLLLPKQEGLLDKSSVQVSLLVLGGIVTALPLLWFANAVRRLPLSVVGFFQYIVPTIQFFLAVYLYSEPFTSAHARSFVCIWSALLIYTIDLWRANQAPARAKQRVEKTLENQKVLEQVS